MIQVDKQTYIKYIKRMRAVPLQVTSNMLIHTVKGKAVARISFLQGTAYYIKTR